MICYNKLNLKMERSLASIFGMVGASQKIFSISKIEVRSIMAKK
jgi:hypothetical protein